MAKVADEVGATANRYQILAKLAVGGMAEIYLVRGASVAGVERYCVLKRILREHASDSRLAQMFLDEARLAAQLQHPNIASVYDIGMLGDSYFFTMEYVHGETLRSLLARALELRRPVPLACAMTIAAGIAGGLHHAHERNANDGKPLGIVHRDISPSNVMVSFEGNVKIVDFGVAKAANRAVETKTGTVKGKISYLSPEQCRGDDVDRRSDLFSLGIVVWELLTCKRLYRRGSDFENMTAIVKEPAPPPSKIRPEVPRAVDDIVLRLLAKPVSARFQTAVEVLEALENAAMRAGTIFSTSALSRLVRDLFGVRAEPWLLLENQPGPREPVSFVSRPVPRQVVRAPVDDLERGLAGVVDLSLHSFCLDALDGDAGPTDAPLEPLAKPAPASAAPPSGSAPVHAANEPSATDTESASPSVPALPPLPPAPVIATLVAPPPVAATPVLAAPPSTSATDLMPPGSFAPPNQPNTTLPWVGAPPMPTTAPVVFTAAIPVSSPVTQLARIPTASTSIPVVEEPASYSAFQLPLPAPPPSGIRDGVSVGAPAIASAWRSSRRASGITWPLLAVIVVASAIGVVVAWISTREDSAPATSPLHATMSPTPAPSDEPGAPAGEPRAATGEPRAATGEPRAPTGEPTQAAANTADAADAVGVIEIAAPEGSSDTGTAAPSSAAPASVPAPETPTVPAAAAKPPSSDRDEQAKAAKDAAAKRRARPRAPIDAGVPAPDPQAVAPSGAELRKLYNENKWDALATACKATTITREIAAVCTYAACHLKDALNGERWAGLAPQASREALLKRCRAILLE